MNLLVHYDFSSSSFKAPSTIKNIAPGDTSNLYDATMVNDPVINSDGIENKSTYIKFNSSKSQYIKIPSMQTTNNGYTITWWFNTAGEGGWARIFDFSNGAGSDNILAGFPSTSLSFYLLKSGAVFQKINAVPVTPNTWIHIGLVYNYPKGCTIYVNGKLFLRESTAYYPNAIFRNTNYIGRSAWNGDWYYNGYISDFRVYNSSLSKEDILSIYNLRKIAITSEIKCTSIIPTWKFQESFSSKYIIKQNGYNTKWSNVGIESNTRMSISFWLTIENPANFWRNIFHLSNRNVDCCNPGDRAPAVWIIPGRTGMHIRNSTPYDSNAGYNTPDLSVDSEQFITIIWNDKNVSVYVDDMLNSQYNFNSPGLPLTAASPDAIFYIGDPWYSQNNELLIRNFSIYNCCLSQENISLLYNSQKILSTIEYNCKSIVPSWQFEDSNINWYKIKQNGYNIKWSSVGIESNSNMSISFWLNINTLHGDWRNIFHLSNRNANCCDLGDRAPAAWLTPNGSNILIVNSTTSNSNDVRYTPEIPLNSEQFVTIVWSGRNIYIYINSILKSQTTFNSKLIPADPAAAFYIGDPWHSQNDGVLIKDFSIYNCSLSQDKISLIYKSTLTTQCTSTIPTWKFQNSLTNWYKIKRNGYNTSWSSLSIDSNKNMSISFWLNITTLYNNWRNIFHLSNRNSDCCNAGDRIPGVWISPGETKMFIVNSTDGNSNEHNFTPALLLKSQQLITIVWRSRIVYIYVNSKLNSQFTYSSTLINAEPNATFHIGDPWYEQNDGLLIRHFSIYNCCLSEANILEIYNSQIISPKSCEYQMSATEIQCYKNNYPQDLTNMNDIQLENHWSTTGCNESRNNQCSSQQTSTGMYNYKGCYNDSESRAIRSLQGNVSSIDDCAKIAESKSHEVFGVQNGGECRTGINEQAAYQYGSNFNKDSCPKLGGLLTNQVYVRSSAFPLPSEPAPYLTNPNFANKENFDNLLDEEKRDENVKIIFKNIIMAIIIILLVIFISSMLKE